MTAMLLFVFIAVHTIDDQLLVINPQQIVTMRDARDAEKRIVHDKVRCVITLADGKLASTKETCAEVRRLIEASRPGAEQK